MLESSTWHRLAHTFWDYVDYDLAETTLKSDPSMLSLPLLLLLNEAIKLPPLLSHHVNRIATKRSVSNGELNTR